MNGAGGPVQSPQGETNQAMDLDSLRREIEELKALLGQVGGLAQPSPASSTPAVASSQPPIGKTKQQTSISPVKQRVAQSPVKAPASPQASGSNDKLPVKPSAGGVATSPALSQPAQALPNAPALSASTTQALKANLLSQTAKQPQNARGSVMAIQNLLSSISATSASNVASQGGRDIWGRPLSAVQAVDNSVKVAKKSSITIAKASSIKAIPLTRDLRDPTAGAEEQAAAKKKAAAEKEAAEEAEAKRRALKQEQQAAARAAEEARKKEVAAKAAEDLKRKALADKAAEAAKQKELAAKAAEEAKIREEERLTREAEAAKVREAAREAELAKAREEERIAKEKEQAAKEAEEKAKAAAARAADEAAKAKESREKAEEFRRLRQQAQFEASRGFLKALSPLPSYRRGSPSPNPISEPAATPESTSPNVNTKVKAASGEVKITPECRIIITGIAAGAEMDDIYTFLKDYSVYDIEMKDHSHAMRPVRYASVTMTSASEAERVVKWKDDEDILGQRVTVRSATRDRKINDDEFPKSIDNTSLSEAPAELRHELDDPTSGPEPSLDHYQTSTDFHPGARSFRPVTESKKTRVISRHAKVCMYFTSPTGCLAGDECVYKHPEQDTGPRQDIMDIDEDDPDLVGRRLYVKWDSALKSKYAF